MDGHKVHALFRVGPDHPEKVLSGDLQQVLFQVPDGVIHGHRADHGRGQVDQLAAEGIGLAVVGQVHDGLGAEVQGHADLVHLCFIVVRVPGNAQVDVDLGPQTFADAFRAQGFVSDIGGNGDLAQGHPPAQFFRVHVLLLGHGLHLRRQDPFLGCFHLGMVLSHGPSSF